MYTSRLFVAFAAAVLTLQTASSTPAPAPRSLVPRLEKLTDACQWPFWISPAGKENKFVATSCRGTNGENVAGSDVNMNQCLANDNGVLTWRWGGNFLKSCDACSMNQTTHVDMHCRCNGKFVSINIDGSTEAQSNGVFVQSNGELAVRCPTS